METRKPGQGRFLRVVIQGVNLEEARQLVARPYSIDALDSDLIRLTLAANAGSIDELLREVVEELPSRASILDAGFVEAVESAEQTLEISADLKVRFFEGDSALDSSGDERDLVIRGGISFGSGFHPTTRMCLELIDNVFHGPKPPGKALDVGTGSGILALAAGRLGAREIVAVEIDLQAALEARENIRRNRAEAKILIVRGSIRAVRGEFDLVTANLAPGPLFSLADELPGLVKPGGLMIVSGFFDAQRERLLSRLNGGLLVESRREQGWNAFLWQRNREA